MTREIQEIFSAAHDAATEAAKTREALAQLLLATMRKLLPTGKVVNLLERPIPEYLASVRVMAGKSHGTHTFRIMAVTHVAANALQPELSTWTCNAVPISEKTGKDMSAATTSEPDRGVVRLHGEIGSPYFHLLEDGESTRRIIDLVANTL